MRPLRACVLVHSFTRVSMIPCQVLGSAECLSLGIPQGSDGGRCSSHSANTFLSKSVRHCTRRRDPKPGFWELSAQWGQPDSTVEGRVLRLGGGARTMHVGSPMFTLSWWKALLRRSRSQLCWAGSMEGPNGCQRIFILWKKRQGHREWFFKVPGSQWQLGPLWLAV